MDWLTRELMTGFQKLLCLGLDRTPASDLIEGTVMAWAEAITAGRAWDQERDAPRIRAAFVYGSVAKGTDQAASDIDLMVIADKLDYADVFGALQTVEAELGRTVNPNVMTRAEWKRKRGQAGFVTRIAGQPRLFVIGTDDDLA